MCTASEIKYCVRKTVYSPLSLKLLILEAGHWLDSNTLRVFLGISHKSKSLKPTTNCYHNDLSLHSVYELMNYRTMGNMRDIHSNAMVYQLNTTHLCTHWIMLHCHRSLSLSISSEFYPP